jgi:hypothetical protein
MVSGRKRLRNEIVVRIIKYWMEIASSGENESGKIWFLLGKWKLKPVTLAAGSEARTVFARSDAGIVGSNPTQGMHLFCVCVVLCLDRGLATS